MATLRPSLDVLGEPQRQLWRELTAVPAHFVLYGGTALALRLGHRKSEDFDFFSNASFSPDQAERDMKFLRGGERLRSEPDTLVVRVDRGGPVTLSLFGGLALRRVGHPDRVDGPGFEIASLLDLAATKVNLVQDRAEAKDYLDVAAILGHGVGLAEALAAAASVYGKGFNALLSLKALCYFADGDLPSVPAKTRELLRDAVRRVDAADLPAVEAIADDIVG